MRWRDAAGLAAKSLRRRFGRSVLTVLAVALAATLLTALVTIAGTAQTKVLSELSKGGRCRCRSATGRERRRPP